MLRRCLALVGFAVVADAAVNQARPAAAAPPAHEHRHKHHHNSDQRNQVCYEEDVYHFCVASMDDDISTDFRKIKFFESANRCFPLLGSYRHCQVAGQDVTHLLEDSLRRKNQGDIDPNSYNMKKTQLIYQCYSCVQQAVKSDASANQDNFNLRKALPAPCAFSKPLKSSVAVKKSLCEEKCAEQLGWKWKASPFSDACKTQTIDICDQVQNANKTTIPKPADRNYASWNGTSYYQGTETLLLTENAQKSWEWKNWLTGRAGAPSWGKDADACYCLKQCKAIFPSCSTALNQLVSKVETAIFKRYSHVCCQNREDLELQFSVISIDRLAPSVIFFVSRTHYLLACLQPCVQRPV
jgi:hypothetical protein